MTVLYSCIREILFEDGSPRVVIYSWFRKLLFLDGPHRLEFLFFY